MLVAVSEKESMNTVRCVCLYVCDACVCRVTCVTCVPARTAAARVRCSAVVGCVVMARTAAGRAGAAAGRAARGRRARRA